MAQTVPLPLGLHARTFPAWQRPTRREPVPRLNDPLIAEQIGQVRPHPPRQGVDRLSNTQGVTIVRRPSLVPFR
jgi:hypothetical protein